VIEIRSFGFKICRAYKRPHWKARTGIGAWSGVLNFLGFLAVITNASMIAVVGSHRAEKYTDSETDDMMYVSEAAYKLPDHCRVNYKPNASETGIDMYACPGLFDRVRVWQLWLLFVGMEHFVMMMRVVVMNISPSDPHWLVDEREILQYRLQKVYKHDPDFHKNSSISYQGAGSRDAQARMQIAVDALAVLTDEERAEAVAQAPTPQAYENGERHRAATKLQAVQRGRAARRRRRRLRRRTARTATPTSSRRSSRSRRRPRRGRYASRTRATKPCPRAG